MGCKLQHATPKYRNYKDHKQIKLKQKEKKKSVWRGIMAGPRKL